MSHAEPGTEASGSTDQERKIADLERALADCRHQLLAYKYTGEEQPLDATGGDRYISFFQNLSHELLTPMNSIKGLVELSLEANLAPKLKNYLQQMQSSCHQLNFIIDELLMIVVLAKGEYHLKHQAFKLADMVNSVVVDHLSNIARKKLELSLTMPPELKHDIVADAYAVAKVLNYLLDNAIKFTETGGIAVHAERVLAATGSTQLQISVADTGVGIDPDFQQKIFEPFFQVDGTMTRKYSGVGLGLAICQQLVQLLGGELQVVSQPGKGTTVSFTINYQDYSSHLPTESAAASSADENHTGATLSGEELRESLHNILTKLQTALAEGDHFEAEQALAKITVAMKALLPNANFSALQQHIADFDFDDALQCLASILMGSESN